jgi:transcriptional regulator with XRE-family HTH domain
MASKPLVGPHGGSLEGVSAVCRRIGANIRIARRKMGYTQEGLADRIDLSPNFIAHLERGSRKPSLDTLMALSRTLEIPLEDLLGTDPAPARAPAEGPMVRRVFRLVREAPADRVELVARLLEEMRIGHCKVAVRPRRGRRASRRP